MLAPSLQLQYCISCSIYAVIVLADYVVVAIVTIVVLAAIFMLQHELRLSICSNCLFAATFGFVAILSAIIVLPGG